MVEAEVALKFVLIVGEGNNGRHEHLVDNRRDEIIYVDNESPVPPDRVGDVKRVDRYLQERTEDDTDKRHQPYSYLRRIVLDALVRIVDQGIVLSHVVVRLFLREIAILQMKREPLPQPHRNVERQEEIEPAHHTVESRDCRGDACGVDEARQVATDESLHGPAWQNGKKKLRDHRRKDHKQQQPNQRCLACPQRREGQPIYPSASFQKMQIEPELFVFHAQFPF